MAWWCGGLTLVWLAIAVWRSYVTAPSLRNQGVRPNRLPSREELALHVPRDVRALREANLGDDVERIVRVYELGRFAMAGIVQHGMTETPISANTATVTTWIEYGWYDDQGKFVKRRTDVASDGLLNRKFDSIHQQSFIVAWDPNSNDHVAFLAQGAVAPIQLAPPTPYVPPAIVQVHAPLAPEVLERVDRLEATILERMDDSVALGVIADRLMELGSDRGELLSLQLARGVGGRKEPRELELLERLGKTLCPSGARAPRFELGVAWAVEIGSKVDWKDPRWKGVHTLKCDTDENSGMSYANAQLPNLRDLSVPRVLSPKAAERLMPKLVTLRLESLEDVWVPALGSQLTKTTTLRQLTITQIRSLPIVLETVLQTAKSLEVLQITDSLFDEQQLVWSKRALTAANSSLLVELGVFGPEVILMLTQKGVELRASPAASARAKIEGQRLLAEVSSP